MRKILKNILGNIRKDLSDYKYGIIMVLVYFAICMGVFKKVCIVRILIGFPCPGCGLTRAVYELFRLNIKESFAYHPLAVLWIAFICFVFIRRYIFNKTDKVIPAVLAGVCAITIAVYMYRMLNCFPDGKALIYDRKNIFAFWSSV